MTRRIPDREFLSLKEVASRLGHELFGSNWEDGVLENLNDRDFGLVLEYLHRVLESPKVATWLDNQVDQPTLLKPEDTLHIEFSVLTSDPKDWQIRVRDSHPRFTYSGKTNRSQLEEFLQSNRLSSSNHEMRRKDEERCFQELVGLMQAGTKEKTKGSYAKELTAKYRLSRDAFNRAWAKAVETTGSNWGKPGPVSSSGSSNTPI